MLLALSKTTRQASEPDPVIGEYMQVRLSKSIKTIIIL